MTRIPPHMKLVERYSHPVEFRVASQETDFFVR
jgi:hypothetical protein